MEDFALLDRLDNLIWTGFSHLIEFFVACTLWITCNFTFNFKKEGSSFLALGGSDTCSFTVLSTGRAVIWKSSPSPGILILKPSLNYYELAILVKVVSAGVIQQLQSWDPKDRKWQILWEKKWSRSEIHRKKTKRKWKAGFWCAAIPHIELFFTLWNTFMWILS